MGMEMSTMKLLDAMQSLDPGQLSPAALRMVVAYNLRVNLVRRGGLVSVRCHAAPGEGVHRHGRSQTRGGVGEYLLLGRSRLK
jgi:hypothetical protein